MKGFRREEGYINIQLPPVILGVIILLGIAHLLTNPDFSSSVPSYLPYLVVVFALSLFGLGIFLTMQTWKYPESPFNQHTSPLAMFGIIFSSLAYAMWQLSGPQYDTLFYVLGGGVIAAVIAALYMLGAPLPKEED